MTEEVVRRAPFADNPVVGERGLRTQQVLLDAALAAFGEEGYDLSSVDSITSRAGCSRASFYQYFSSKSEIFRHLAGQVARQLAASTDALEALTPDAAGRDALRAWIRRHSAIHRRYQPMFRAFPAASESDDVVATGAARWSARTVSTIRSKIDATALRTSDADLDLVILSLLECVSGTHDVAQILRDSDEDHWSEDRIDDALADVVHRSLFGRQDAVNVHSYPGPRPPVIPFDHTLRSAFALEEPAPQLGPAGSRTRAALLDAGRKAFVERGYHRTRVGDVTAAAGVSRASFYHYFDNRDQIARALTARAIQGVSAVLAAIPAPGERGYDRAQLRRWLRRYDLAQANEAAMIRVWVDASLQDSTLRANTAPALDWGRRQMASFLAPRGFGDVDAEGIVMIALLSAFGSRERSAAELAAAAHIVEQGLLGLDAS